MFSAAAIGYSKIAQLSAPEINAQHQGEAKWFQEHRGLGNRNRGPGAPTARSQPQHRPASWPAVCQDSRNLSVPPETAPGASAQGTGQEQRRDHHKGKVRKCLAAEDVSTEEPKAKKNGCL